MAINEVLFYCDKIQWGRIRDYRAGLHCFTDSNQ